MNKGALQNIGVQQMMGATNNNYPPSLWNINNNNNLIKPPFTSSSPSSSSSTITNNFFSPPPPNNNNNIISPNYNIISPNYNNSMNMSMNSSTWLDDDSHFQEHPNQFHESLSQLLLSGILMGEEGRKMEKWEEQIEIEYHHSLVDQMKQESSVNSYNNNNNNNISNKKNNNMFITHQINNNIATSSPQSCVSTTLSDNNLHPRHHNPLLVSDNSSECNSTRTSGAQKKPKIQPSSTSPSTFKVRKEKLGDRITSLHQLVSPFGKTDTASVLLEAIGYIRFLHGQIEALSLPYLTSGAGDKSQPHLVEGEKKCIFPEDPGQLSNEKSSKEKGSPNIGQDSNEEAVKDLRSKGLCLVPLSCTMHVGSDNGADYWAPGIGGGGFR
ncbi:hypothetical protein vseg_000135 [Gypsophila vaccaria]